MSNTRRVRWTVTPIMAPRPWLSCGRCHAIKPFACSGKIRLNANGKQLDAWLIYRCADCDKTWNRPIFERRNVKDIDPAALRSLQSNDKEWVRAIAFDLQFLRRRSSRVEEFVDVEVRKTILVEATQPWSALEIVLAVPTPTSLRLDRLLATEFGMSRAHVTKLERDGRLRASPERGHGLRRPITEGTVIALDLPQAGDALAIGLAASRSG
jgi:hypothetical protein